MTCMQVSAQAAHGTGVTRLRAMTMAVSYTPALPSYWHSDPWWHTIPPAAAAFLLSSALTEGSRHVSDHGAPSENI